jgi:hypothetical protein
MRLLLTARWGQLSRQSGAAVRLILGDTADPAIVIWRFIDYYQYLRASGSNLAICRAAANNGV